MYSAASQQAVAASAAEKSEKPVETTSYSLGQWWELVDDLEHLEHDLEELYDTHCEDEHGNVRTGSSVAEREICEDIDQWWDEWEEEEWEEGDGEDEANAGIRVRGVGGVVAAGVVSVLVSVAGLVVGAGAAGM